MTIIFIIILVIFLPLFMMSLFRKKIEISWPWLWKNIGAPIFKHYFVMTNNKLVNIYFGAVVSICMGKSIIQWGIKLTFGKDKGVQAINIETANNNIDCITLLIIVCLTIIMGLHLYLSYKSNRNSSVTKEKTLVVLYGAKIADDNPLLNYNSSLKAISSKFQPSEGSPIRIQMNGNTNSKEDWERESQNLENEIKQSVLPYLRTARLNHISLFGLAPMPLLVKLGTILNEKYSVDVYQKHRNPDNWCYLKESTEDFIVNRPEETTKAPVLVLSLSDSIIGRIEHLYGNNSSIWEVTVRNPNMDLMRTKEQLETYKKIIRDLLNEISQASSFPSINVHMAVPVSCAIELGRVWMPKPHKSLVLFDYRNNVENKTITIEDKIYN